MPLAPQDVRTFFVTSVTIRRHAIFQSERMANLLIRILQDYRRQQKFLLHEFVIMPDHFHLLLTPAAEVPLEKAIQYIKGGFSFRARKELDFQGSIWEASFTNHRIRDEHDYEHHRSYIRQNPVKRFLVETEERFPYSSAYPDLAVDPGPPWLKP
ncbi:MAG: transposase [Candidatus Acidiferrales bacterium]